MYRNNDRAYCLLPLSKRHNRLRFLCITLRIYESKCKFLAHHWINRGRYKIYHKSLIFQPFHRKAWPIGLSSYLKYTLIKPIISILHSWLCLQFELVNNCLWHYQQSILLDIYRNNHFQIWSNLLNKWDIRWYDLDQYTIHRIHDIQCKHYYRHLPMCNLGMKHHMNEC